MVRSLYGGILHNGQVRTIEQEKLPSRWYDGLFYNIVADPMAGRSFIGPILSFIPENSTVIDIGCGVGSVVAALAKKCSHVTGVELSPRMAAFARKKLVGKSINNADILNLSAAGLSSNISLRYDYAVMTQFLHELSEDIRYRVMEEAMKMAGAFIIADFITPYPDTFLGRIIRLVELSAGSEHNANFKDWLGRGGLDGFLARCGLTILDERIFSTGVGKIVRAIR